MPVLPALIHVLAHPVGPRGEPVGARALEPALNVGASPVAAHARVQRALVRVHATLT